MTQTQGGQTLEERLAAPGVSLAEAIEIGIQLAQHLADDHAAGIVHHSLGASSVRVAHDPTMPSGVRVTLDWASDTHAESPAYMAPEQLTRIAGGVDARADLYAFGVLLFQAVTGRLPFMGPTRAELIGQHLCEPPPPPRSLAAVPRALEELLLRLLAKRRDARPRSAEAVVSALRAIRVVAEYGRAQTQDDNAFAADDTMPAFSACA